MIMVTDFGCCQHRERHLKYFGPEALVMENVIANLPAEGGCHTYICQHGFSHRVAVDARMPEVAAEGAYARRKACSEGKRVISR